MGPFLRIQSTTDTRTSLVETRNEKAGSAFECRALPLEIARVNPSSTLHRVLPTRQTGHASIVTGDPLGSTNHYRAARNSWPGGAGEGKICPGIRTFRRGYGPITRYSMKLVLPTLAPATSFRAWTPTPRWPLQTKPRGRQVRRKAQIYGRIAPKTTTDAHRISPGATAGGVHGQGVHHQGTRRGTHPAPHADHLLDGFHGERRKAGLQRRLRHEATPRGETVDGGS